MDEVDDCKFLDNDTQSVAAIPVVFIYDRTAALEEGDDQKEALLYPVMQAEVTEADKVVVTKLINLVGQLMGLASKLEQELGCSLPTICRLEDVNFFFLHVGKYTISLRRPSSYSESAARQELETLYSLFNTFYGGFSTAHIPTSASKLTNNPDNAKAKELEGLMKFISKIYRPELAERVGSWSLQEVSSTTTSNNRANKKLVNQLSLLLESLCSTYAIVGALARVNGKLVLSKNLKPQFIQLLTLSLSGDLAELGASAQFVVENVTVLSCHLTEEHLCSNFNTRGKAPFHAMIHLYGDLSMTLLVKSDTDPLLGQTFQDVWRRPCTKLKDELLHLHHNFSSNSNHSALSALTAMTSSIRTVRLHKPSNTVFSMSHQPSGSDSRLSDNKRNSNAALTQSNYQDWYMKSVAISQQAFTDMPSVTEIRLVSPTDSVLHATQDAVNNTFTGAADVRNVSTFPSQQYL